VFDILVTVAVIKRLKAVFIELVLNTYLQLQDAAILRHVPPRPTTAVV